MGVTGPIFFPAETMVSQVFIVRTTNKQINLLCHLRIGVIPTYHDGGISTCSLEG